MSNSLTNSNQETSHYYCRPRVVSIHTFKILLYLVKREGTASNSDIIAYLNKTVENIVLLLILTTSREIVGAPGFLITLLRKKD